MNNSTGSSRTPTEFHCEKPCAKHWFYDFVRCRFNIDLQCESEK